MRHYEFCVDHDTDGKLGAVSCDACTEVRFSTSTSRFSYASSSTLNPVGRSLGHCEGELVCWVVCSVAHLVSRSVFRWVVCSEVCSVVYAVVCLVGGVGGLQAYSKSQSTLIPTLIYCRIIRV